MRRSSAKARKAKVEGSCCAKESRKAVGTYRVHTPLFAILTLESDRVPITIPVNAFIDVNEMWEDTGDKTLVEIEWNARTLMMFARDLLTRAAIVPASPAQ